ncbi:MAG TPA: chaperone NapD [Rhodocyclaceae bacterium]|nr:chaperone NapD [Rhodocyclaceae bacterium]
MASVDPRRTPVDNNYALVKTMNLSSLIVIPHPDRVESLVAALGALDGVDIAAVSQEGKVIATIEADSDRETIETYELISQLDGLLSASMVYHQSEIEPEEVIAVEA